MSLIKYKLEEAAANLASSSLANISSSWNVYRDLDDTFISGSRQAPAIRIEVEKWAPYDDKLSIGVGACILNVIAVAEKHVTPVAEFEEVASAVFEGFFTGSINHELMTRTSGLFVYNVQEAGEDVSTISDGFIATQQFLVTCGRQQI